MTSESASGADGVFVHPLALCESRDVGDQTRIWAFAHVMNGAVVGRDCNIGDHAFIESGAVIGDDVTVKNSVMVFDGVTVEDHVFLGPGMTFTNDPNPRAEFKKPGPWTPTRVGRYASIGAGVVVVCGTTIGEGAFVGAGSVVVTDLGAYALVVGNPARRIGWMCRCGTRLPDTMQCPTCRCSYTLVSEPHGLDLDLET